MLRLADPDTCGLFELLGWGLREILVFPQSRTVQPDNRTYAMSLDYMTKRENTATGIDLKEALLR